MSRNNVVSDNKKLAGDAIYSTAHGKLFCGDSFDVLKSRQLKKYKGSVQLVFTSPPFPLNTKKRYGNRLGKDYIEWLASFAPLLREFLTSDGSIVLEVGNAWEPGEPVMSTIVLRALLEFLERGEFHLCQEFVCYNPARLPSPIQWVNVERSRVKDAFTRIWWMSPITRPKADNRRVLREYSASMQKLLKSKKYNSGARPSQHVIGRKSFVANNGGAIPPNVIGADDLPSLTNLLKGTNTRSSDQYQLFCRERDLPLHPARMPAELAEFFIRFLTESGDFVLDPFAGSNTTGAVADSLDRRWLSIEASWDYASASASRFSRDDIKQKAKGVMTAKPRHSSSSNGSASPLFTS